MAFGFAGNDINGPSFTERFVGGLPRNFPFGVVLLLGHADDTAVPCLLLDRIFCDCNAASSNAESGGCALIGVTADIGCGVDGVSFNLQRIVVGPGFAVAGLGARFEGVTQWSPGNLSKSSGYALMLPGYAE